MHCWTRWACVGALLSGCSPAEGAAADTEGGDEGTQTSLAGDDTSGTAGDDDAEPEPPAPPVAEPWAARLTNAQYANTVLDVLGVALTDAERAALPADFPTGRDYSTAVATQSLTAQHVIAYADVALSVTERVGADDLASTFGACQDLTDPACTEAFIRGLGVRLFRRPLRDEEVLRLTDLAAAIEEGEHNTTDDIAPGLAAAMLQMPAFLYRVERETDGDPGEHRTLDGYELATRLSYFLWQSAPDDALLEFAAGPTGDGAYDTSALPGEVERMLEDPRFARSRELFWGDYTLASRSSFGTADAALAAELRESLSLTLEQLFSSAAGSRPLTDLFSGDTFIMTPSVAALAGIEEPREGPASYSASELQQRRGVVTHPAFLAAIGTTSFVGRGLFLSERLLCQEVMEPPESIEEEIENTAQATQGMTPREASEYRFGLEPVCQVCHLQFEPIAYAFERYDILGAYTESDANGRALFSDGALPMLGDRPEVPFNDAPELLEALSGMTWTQQCLVENMSEFGLGHPADSSGAWLEAKAASFTERGSTFEALVRVIALSDALAEMKVVKPG